jgi:hypothetical protein
MTMEKKMCKLFYYERRWRLNNGITLQTPQHLFV